ncbi:TIGR02206 family membrane protein [Bacillus sp. Marseille-Q1617]|uniref:YwaF family protein n=1 Tax=Bacillus sp. Marseille-Q1617 TaxID=2736887 RepID=UPI001588DA39|nr:TIGR02206 family membrane protein [Bacillus sp. Marseille-Q1617]
MKDLLNFRYEEYPFELFSLSHIYAVILMLVIISLMYLYRNRLTGVSEKAIRWILISLMAAGEVFFHVWYAVNDVWSLAINLPFQLCSISLYLCIIMLLTRNRLLFEITFFASMTGAFVAMVTPELFFGFPHIRYFQFFIVHSSIVLSCFYMVWIEGFTVTIFSPLKSFLALNIIAAGVYGMNILLGANYMFLTHKPFNPSPIDYLGEYPWYLISLESISFFLFYLIYIPFHIRKIVKK